MRKKGAAERIITAGMIAFAVLFIAFAVVLPILSSFITELWWFEDLGQKAVFVKRILTAIGTGGAAFMAVAAFMLINSAIITRAVPSGGVAPGRDMRPLKYMTAAASLIVGAAAGLSMGANWMAVQQFIYATPFAKADPVFGIDASFYVFKLPLYEILYRGAMQILVAAALMAGLSYLFGALVMEPYEVEMAGPFGSRRQKSFRMKFEKVGTRQRNHLIVLVAAIFAGKAAGYVLDIYRLVYSPRGVAFGASYADIYGSLPGLKVMIALCFVSAGLVILALIRKRGLKPVIAAAAIMLAGSFLTGTVVPGLVQQWYVEPNELEAEERFINYNIDFTRAGYDLDKIEERDFVSDGEITKKDLADNSRTVENIRLWDWEPLLSTLSQLQEMRLYYNFYDVDIDRYMVDGKLRQVMLTAREMDVDSLPEQAQTWINRHLKYTHGYGLVISPVNEATAEGLPTYLLKDIPPQGNKSFAIERPEIYFGELTDDYAIVDTAIDEFDYPMGEQNAETRWQGEGGVSLGSFFRRLMFSYKFGTVKMLLSGDITEQSRVLYRRAVTDRLYSMAPFLWYDADPYIVIAEGRLLWVADAYTYTEGFPYSEPIPQYSSWGKGPNYMRNSVKAVVDAYTGEASFYIVDGSDPIAKTYSDIFPGLFKDGSEMPEEIKSHFRYPEDLFTIQARMYAIYHMEDAAQFYNKEDLWAIPYEVYGSRTAEMKPYYVNMSLPDDAEKGQSFLSMIPFTPAGKNNMVSWMAGLCDGDDYGKMIVYKFSKQRIFYGPMQIESQIDQDSEISKLFALWSQKGSSVIRGNLLVYPIDSSVLYIEPVFLAAERSQLPQLKLVLASDGTRIAMGSNLAEALAMLVGSAMADITPGQDSGQDAASLALEAERAYNRALESLKSSDWTEYGKAQEELGRLLTQLITRLEDEQ